MKMVLTVPLYFVSPIPHEVPHEGLSLVGASIFTVWTYGVFSHWIHSGSWRKVHMTMVLGNSLVTALKI